MVPSSVANMKMEEAVLPVPEMSKLLESVLKTCPVGLAVPGVWSGGVATVTTSGFGCGCGAPLPS